MFILLLKDSLKENVCLVLTFRYISIQQITVISFLQGHQCYDLFVGQCLCVKVLTPWNSFSFLFFYKWQFFKKSVFLCFFVVVNFTFQIHSLFQCNFFKCVNCELDSLWPLIWDVKSINFSARGYYEAPSRSFCPFRKVVRSSPFFHITVQIMFSSTINIQWNGSIRSLSCTGVLLTFHWSWWNLQNGLLISLKFRSYHFDLDHDQLSLGFFFVPICLIEGSIVVQKNYQKATNLPLQWILAAKMSYIKSFEVWPLFMAGCCWLPKEQGPGVDDRIYYINGIYCV